MSKNPKFVFGKTPETFKRTIEIIDIDRNVSEIEFTFKYRTKKQFAELLDEGVKAAKAEHAANTPDEEKSGLDSISDQFYADLYASSDKKSAEYVMKIAKAWDLADEFSVENLMKLEDSHAGSLQNIIQVYSKSVSEVRTKN